MNFTWNNRFCVPPPPVFGSSERYESEGSNQCINSQRNVELLKEFTSSKAILKGIEDPDQIWLKQFEDHIRTEQRSKPSNIKISLIQSWIDEYKTLLSEISDHTTMISQEKNMAKILVYEEKVKDLKGRIDLISCKINDKYNQSLAKKLIEKRRQKRARVKRNKRTAKESKEVEKREKQENENNINSWLSSCQKAHSMKKMTKNLEADADSTMAEVLKKQNDIKQYQHQLDALVSLRQARISNGHASSREADEIFDLKIAKMKKVLEDQSREYDTEENALKVMLEEDETVTSKKLVSKSTRLENQIYSTYFGKSSSLSYLEPTTMNELKQRRSAWDAYIVGPSNPLGSSVPLGWVLPPATPTGGYNGSSLNL